MSKFCHQTLLAFVALALLAGCKDKATNAKGGAGRGRGPVPVAVATAKQRDVPLVIEVIGTARAYASISVKTRVDGQLAKVAFKSGDQIKKGDVVFEIDPRPFEAALKQAEAVLARDIASLENAETDMKRTDELAGTKAVPATVVDANRAKAASLRASVEADRAAVQTAKLQLSFCTVASPVDGRLGLLAVDEGNMVKNNDTILAVINQTRPMYVDFSLPEQYLLQVRDASAQSPLVVEASLPQDPRFKALGKLDVIDNQVDRNTGTVLLRALFPNEDERLWPGQFLNVQLRTGVISNAVVVPSQAIQNSQTGEFVFVVTEGSKVVKRPVVLGPTQDNDIVVRQGVQPGEVVVVDGQMQLVPDAKVEIKSRLDDGANTTAKSE